ncbi:MAG: class I SAM-dependent methyltransferase [Paludibacterium sp.]|uniref:SAM-dependent methyltransferase n=1 Tax=Paludibacterium sp. TaxID=1917523 RepID=UPI0025FF4858|nr:cyclopropane-fatty-acyl-phospholipid synthase family protein [Paludibacterium sp.]MBV8047638.1 class I SAM-dependent methyltransferase [Paludibacterium sp.]MBV8647320.1 class I SAM-dependent methyltransferase [Paludibacterium sp.]
MIKKRFSEFADKVRRQANLPARIKLWSGEIFDLGEFSIPKIVISVTSPLALPGLITPTLDTLGTAYVNGHLDVEGQLTDIIDMSYLLTRLGDMTSTGKSVLEKAAQRLMHTRASDKQAIQYHYDVSNAFYQQFLDKNLVYSCAYFENGDEDLATAQIKKLDHILTKIRIRPGQRLLDIGCGWGALVIRAAQQHGAHCTGVTLSQNQYEFATEQVKRLGLEDQVTIALCDYRDVTGQFDRITSVGMFEHVGRANLVSYFSKISDLLTFDGLCLNHGITLSDADHTETKHGGGRFIDQFVFPDGELPHIGQALKAMQQGGLESLDVENLRRHYAKTLAIWSRNYEKNSASIRQMVDEQRHRIWRVYLAGCAYAFDQDDVSLYQVLCQKSGQPSRQIEWSRRYMYCAA